MKIFIDFFTCYCHLVTCDLGKSSKTTNIEYYLLKQICLFFKPGVGYIMKCRKNTPYFFDILCTGSTGNNPKRVMVVD